MPSLASIERSAARARAQLIQSQKTAGPGERDRTPVPDREKLLAQCFGASGSGFLDAIAQFAVNENGNPIRLDPWFREYLTWLGDFRIPTKGISGAQQSGKSLGCTLFLAYCTIELGLKMIYAYDSKEARNSQVTLNLRPILDSWEMNKGISSKGCDRNTEIWQSAAGGFAKYVYASVNKAGGQRAGLAAAGGTNVGFQADGLIDEERSQSPPGARDPFYRRLVESKFKPMPPHLNLGTPGGGLGIELDFQDYDHHFYPFYRCPNCGAVKPLHPKGCLLKPVEGIERGERVLRWFGASGKPLDWWHSNPEKLEGSAFFACSQCGSELSEETRKNAWFQEVWLTLKFDVEKVCDRTLQQYLDELPEGPPTEQRSTGLIISPLLAQSAPSMIRQLVTTKNPPDAHQQVLGIPSEAGASAITEEMIRRCVGLPVPERDPDCILAGTDQGTHQDWLWIARCWLPSGHSDMTASEIAEGTIMSVDFSGAVQRFTDVPRLLREYKVDLCAYDNEPEISDGIRLSRDSGVKLGDQKTGVAYDIRPEIRIHDEQEYLVYNFRQEDFQNQVANSFELTADDGLPLWRLPDSWNKWLQLRNDERSPVRHLCSMQKDPELGRWIRPDDRIDDQFFSGMFLKLALRIWLCERKSSVDFHSSAAGERPIRREFIPALD